MNFEYYGITASHLMDVLDDQSLVGRERHVLIELFNVFHLHPWEWARTEQHLSELLDVPAPEVHELLREMSGKDLIKCSQDMKSGNVSGIDLSDAFVELLKQHSLATQAAERQHRRPRGPRPPTEGVKRRTHELFEETCELCSDRAVKGKDQHGKRMQVSRIKKDGDGVAENVTLLCSRCYLDTRSRDLPNDCRSLRMLEIAEERGYADAPRTAVKPIKEVVLVAQGPISVKTRIVGDDQPA